MKTRLLLGLLLPASLVATTAFADDKAACLDAATKGQRFKDTHKLVEARDQLRICAAAACPAVVQTDCANWLAEVEKALPTVVVTAKSGAGADLVDVKVTVDGQPLVSKLDGQAIPMNAGPHTFHFEGADGTLDQQVVVTEGEKSQKVAIVLGAPPPAPDTGGSSTWKTVGWVLGGVGVAGLGVGTVAGLIAMGDKNNAGCNSSNVCNQGTTGAIEEHSAHLGHRLDRWRCAACWWRCAGALRAGWESRRDEWAEGGARRHGERRRDGDGRELLMMRPWMHGAIWSAAGFSALAGCESLLDTGSLTERAGDAGLQDATSADSSGSGSGSGSGGASDSGSSSGGGNDSGACTSGATRCSGTQPQKCDATGSWQNNGAACGANQTCTGGACGGLCGPGQLNCNGQQPQTCDGTGHWQNMGSACANETCVSGACTGVCGPTQTTCIGSTPQTCSAAGQWQSGTACSGANPFCISGSCAANPPSCTPGGAGMTNCGGGSASCCTSLEVTGGTY